MAIQIRKMGQGRYTRGATAVAVGLVDLAVCYYLYTILQRAEMQFAGAVYVLYAVPAAVFVGIAAVMFWYLNKAEVVEFLITTESEMKKVSWSSKAELIGSTGVVIATVLVLAALITVCDFLFIRAYSGLLGLW